MPSPIYIKRRLTGPGAPTNLEPGELAYNDTGHLLAVGDRARAVQLLVGPNRQVEITGKQDITGPKKFVSVTDIQIAGGAANDFLQTDGAGILSWKASPPPTPATSPEMIAGTLNNVYGTPLNTMALTGLAITALTTQTKTIVPAINEVKAAVDLIAIGSIFVGSFKASPPIAITWTVASATTGNVLPTAAQANRGWQLICEVGGTVPAADPSGMPAGTYNVGDWLLSNGAVWTHLAYGGIAAVTAPNVPVVPVLAGGDDVQEVLTTLTATDVQHTADILLKADKSYVDAQNILDVKKVGDTMTGPLVIPDLTGVSLGGHAANKNYVDAGNAAQDITIATMATKAYVDTENGAQDTATTAADLLRVLKAGDTMTGALELPLAAPTLDVQAANKKYVDDSVAAMVGGATIITDMISIGGDGSGASPVTLLLVDAGTY